MGKIDAILIAGPTASGKSRLAMELAERHHGVVINADSLQVYDGLEILTARPSAEDVGQVPHHLYGHVDPRADYSAGAYLRDVAALLPGLRRAGTLPIFCGGTGLYFKALTGLLDVMPEIPMAIRAKWRDRLIAEGAEALSAELQRRDPEMAARLGPRDGQRIARALEIVEATGRSLLQLQAGKGPALINPSRAHKIVLAPERAALRERIATRFDLMLAAGALEEVRRFAVHFPDAGPTAIKAIGLAELVAVLGGEMSLDAARERAITRTRQYAKRQETWFRHQFDDDWLRVTSVVDLSQALRLL
ncbi:tRNA (adenosine(37)-N6)-dimethylallyltransferase MiaA [Jiella sp. MQZ9-1]|nr:tRNA (adenosine(37)-N6)-dimethylallyltransferase MiaA [Jiella flava]MCD2471902.1 tRNA (adenosine(37)-N6)-dimethylallyltransferase MiaA [Jiella flava]